ncbi:MAG: cell division protein ZapD [Alphaproteobacteria bacterium]|jgi:cell division protein ZapD
MSVALYEFPLCEKVRNYLRLEQLFAQLNEAKQAQSENQYLYFFEVFFNVIDLVERLDLRTDFLRDIDSHERKLLHWSQHPDIDNNALETALQNLQRVGVDIKKNKKLGASLRDDRFLANIRQRFSIAGGVTSFDLPSLFCWLKQDNASKQSFMDSWLAQLKIIENSLEMLMSFLREKSRFQEMVSQSGYYQGTVEDKIELVRIQCNNTNGIYPVVSGSRNRYGVKFMKLNAQTGTSGAVTNTIEFQLSCC